MPPVRKLSNLRCFAAFCFVQWARLERANKINEPAVPSAPRGCFYCIPPQLLLLSPRFSIEYCWKNQGKSWTSKIALAKTTLARRCVTVNARTSSAVASWGTLKMWKICGTSSYMLRGNYQCSRSTKSTDVFTRPEYFASNFDDPFDLPYFYIYRVFRESLRALVAQSEFHVSILVARLRAVSKIKNVIEIKKWHRVYY